MKKILITGYYGYSNSGDDAILSSICRDIQELGDHEITILSNNPESTKSEYGVNALYRFNYRVVKEQILKSDIVLMGGGSLLQDKTSTRSLFYYLWTIWFAKKHDKKCMLYGNGIGPVSRKLNRKLTKWIGNKVDIITLREGLSNDELKSLGIVQPKIYVTADPVFNLTTSDMDVKHIFIEEEIDTSKPLVAVLFRSWGHSEGFAEKTAKLCDHIIGYYNMNVLLIPMNYPKDLEISNEILNQMKNKAYLLKNKYDAFTLIEIIGQMKLVLSMRLHALLYASIKNVPMIGFVYDPKVEYYLKELNMPSAGDIYNYNLDLVKQQIEEIFSHYGEIQKSLNIKVLQLREKSQENRSILSELMSDTVK